MRISVRKYIVNIVYLVHVSATHLAILREVRYKAWIYRGTQKFVKQSTDVKCEVLKILIKLIINNLMKF
jgi:hypothetical protein